MLPEPDKFLILVQSILRGLDQPLAETEWKRIRQFWLDGETDPDSILTRIRQQRLWSR
jgi:hypothetical protein